MNREQWKQGILNLNKAEEMLKSDMAKGHKRRLRKLIDELRDYAVENNPDLNPGIKKAYEENFKEDT